MQTMTMGESVAQRWADRSPATDSRTTDLVELMLKDQRRLDALIRDDAPAADLIPRLLAVAVVGFTIFGIASTLIMNLGYSLPSWVPRARWTDGTWANLTLAYVLGLVASTGVCLPSFYFYGLLAGVKLSMLQSAAHAVKCLAVTSVVLVGGLPIYVAVSLGMIVFGGAGRDVALDNHAGPCAAVRRRPVGSQNPVLGVRGSRRHDAALPQDRASVLPPSVDRRVGCLLHHRHAGDDRLALDAPLRLTASLSSPSGKGGFWRWVLPRQCSFIT